MKTLGSCLAVVFAALLGCSPQEPIRIGFAGNITGRASDTGVDARDGALLAVEEINAKGGIGGRKIELIVKDDQNNPEIARKVSQELVDAKVVATIGHVVSGMTQAALPLANEKKMLLVSPTSVSNAFTGKDDYLIRVSPAAKLATVAFADFAFQKIGTRSLAFIYDLGNKSYSEDWYKNFLERYQTLGGKNAFTLTYTTGPGVNFTSHATQLLAKKPDGIVIIAGAQDAALISQRIRNLNQKLPIFIAGWAMTNDLLVNGGSAVEGAYLPYNFDKDSKAPAYAAFRTNYEKRFGNPPGFAAKYSYEAVSLLAQALSKAPLTDGAQLKKTIIEQGTFSGLQGDFRIDAHGDAETKTLIFTVAKGTFQRID